MFRLIAAFLAHDHQDRQISIPPRLRHDCQPQDNWVNGIEDLHGYTHPSHRPSR